MSRVSTYIVLLCISTCLGCGNSEQPAKLNAAEQARRAAKNDTTTLRVDPKKLRTQLGANEMAKFLVEGNDVVEANLFARDCGPSNLSGDFHYEVSI